MVATFNSKPSTTIISSNSPTNARGERDLYTFYNGLSFLIRSIPKINVQIIGGDMNAQINKNVNKFNLHNPSNRNAGTPNRLHTRKGINMAYY